MSHQTIDVTYVANLARLALSSEETEKFQAQLRQVLSHVEQLSSLNIEGIEPTAHGIPRTNVFRSDEVTQSIGVEAALQNAPSKLDDLFRVPKVVE